MDIIPQAGPASPPTAENITYFFQSVHNPKKISPELEAFMGIDSKVTFFECVMFITKYFEDNGLRRNLTEFNLDQPLKELFHIPDETIYINIFDLSEYIMKHTNL